MLTKETQKIAETIAKELAPNYKELFKLGAKFEKVKKEAYQTEEKASAWHWKRTPESKKQLHQNAKEWGEVRDRLYIEVREKETAEAVTRYNYTMSLYDLCATLGELVRPYWKKLQDKKGFQSLCEYVNKANEPKGAGYTPKVAKVFIYSGYDFTNDRQFNIKAFSLGACGLSADLDVYYKKNEQEEPQPIKERQRLTVAQYLAKIRKLNEIKQKAEQIEKQAREVGGDLWRFGFVKNWYIKNN